MLQPVELLALPKEDALSSGFNLRISPPVADRATERLGTYSDWTFTS
jgi:hypothetical protein